MSARRRSTSTTRPRDGGEDKPRVGPPRSDRGGPYPLGCFVEPSRRVEKGEHLEDTQTTRSPKARGDPTGHAAPRAPAANNLRRRTRDGGGRDEERPKPGARGRGWATAELIVRRRGGGVGGELWSRRVRRLLPPARGRRQSERRHHGRDAPRVRERDPGYPRLAVPLHGGVLVLRGRDGPEIGRTWVHPLHRRGRLGLALLWKALALLLDEETASSSA